MAPVHLICGSLLKSLAITSSTDATAKTDRLHSSHNGSANGLTNGNSTDIDIDIDDDVEFVPNTDAEHDEATKRKLETRKLRITQTEELIRKQTAAAEEQRYTEQQKIEKQLLKIAKRVVELSF